MAPERPLQLQTSFTHGRELGSGSAFGKSLPVSADASMLRELRRALAVPETFIRRAVQILAEAIGAAAAEVWDRPRPCDVDGASSSPLVLAAAWPRVAGTARPPSIPPSEGAPVSVDGCGGEGGAFGLCVPAAVRPGAEPSGVLLLRFKTAADRDGAALERSALLSEASESLAAGLEVARRLSASSPLEGIAAAFTGGGPRPDDSAFERAAESVRAALGARRCYVLQGFAPGLDLRGSAPAGLPAPFLCPEARPSASSDLAAGRRRTADCGLVCEPVPFRGASIGALCVLPAAGRAWSPSDAALLARCAFALACPLAEAPRGPHASSSSSPTPPCTPKTPASPGAGAGAGASWGDAPDLYGSCARLAAAALRAEWTAVLRAGQPEPLGEYSAAAAGPRPPALPCRLVLGEPACFEEGGRHWAAAPAGAGHLLVASRRGTAPPRPRPPASARTSWALWRRPAGCSRGRRRRRRRPSSLRLRGGGSSASSGPTSSWPVRITRTLNTVLEVADLPASLRIVANVCLPWLYGAFGAERVFLYNLSTPEDLTSARSTPVAEHLASGDVPSFTNIAITAEDTAFMLRTMQLGPVPGVLLVEDVEELLRNAPPELTAKFACMRTKSTMSALCVFSGTYVGYIGVERVTSRAGWRLEEDGELLRRVAEAFAAALAHARLFASHREQEKALRRQLRDKDLLARVTRSLLADQVDETLEQLLSRGAEVIGGALSAQRVCLWECSSGAGGAGAGPPGASTPAFVWSAGSAGPDGSAESAGSDAGAGAASPSASPSSSGLAGLLAGGPAERARVFAAMDQSPEGVLAVPDVAAFLAEAAAAGPASDDAAAPGPEAPPGARAASSMATRAYFQGAVQGVVVVEMPGEAVQWSREDALLLRQAADQMGVAIAHARLVGRYREQNAELQRQLTHSSLLQAITREIHQVLGVREVFATSCNLVRQAFAASRVRITCLDEPSLDAVSLDPALAPPAGDPRRGSAAAEYDKRFAELSLEAVSAIAEAAGPAPAPGAPRHIPAAWGEAASAKDPIASWRQLLLNSGRDVLAINDVHDPRELQRLGIPLDHGFFEQLRRKSDLTGIKSMMVAVTTFQGKRTGVISVSQLDRRRAWHPDELRLLQTVAEQIGVAIAQSRLLSSEKEQRELLASQNAALEEARREADAASRSKSQFLAMVSHEVRTPMNAILNMADFLLDTELTESQRDFCATIQNSSTALLNILRDILDTSRLEFNKVEIRPAPLALPGLVEQVVDLMGPSAAQKGLDLSWHIARGCPRTLHADGPRLNQILVNLLGNAIKFTSKGEISVRVYTAPAPPPGTREGLAAGAGGGGAGGGEAGPAEAAQGEGGAAGSSSQAEAKPEALALAAAAAAAAAAQGGGALSEWLLFEIRDTGIGISREGQQRLFSWFYQVDSSHSRQYAGTGLGLFISRKLALLMGGDLTVRSEEGAGSTFVLALPLAGLLLDEPSPARTGSGPSSASSSRGGMEAAWRAAPVGLVGRTVAIWSRSAVTRDLLREALEDAGAAVREIPAPPARPTRRGARPPELEIASPYGDEEEDEAEADARGAGAEEEEEEEEDRSPPPSDEEPEGGAGPELWLGPGPAGAKADAIVWDVGALSAAPSLDPQIPRMAERAGIPCVALAPRGYPCLGVVVQSCSAVVSKPVKPRALLDTLEKALAHGPGPVPGLLGSGLGGLLGPGLGMGSRSASASSALCDLDQAALQLPQLRSPRASVASAPSALSYAFERLHAAAPRPTRAGGRRVGLVRAAQRARGGLAPGEPAPGPGPGPAASPPPPRRPRPASPTRSSRPSPPSASPRRPRPRPAPAPSPKAAAGAAPIRVLVAEDVAVNVKILLLMLQKRGYPSADVVPNGLEAVRAVRGAAAAGPLRLPPPRHHDVRPPGAGAGRGRPGRGLEGACRARPAPPAPLRAGGGGRPVMDGLTAARRIAEEVPRAQRPYIIALTANAMQGDREAALAAGMHDYIPKPVRPDVLVAALERCRAALARGGLAGRPEAPAQPGPGPGAK
eukprot:tig00020510_g9811.t1